mmetsp:Transcript_18405/g.58806  ORF Transcript_18405/g.58806 Transcript_18405/m.58806 type:complete len:128 (-) Transcript_18405:77-460(-)
MVAPLRSRSRFPPRGAGGRPKNLDVRDVWQSDSAFLLVGALPAGQAFESLPDNFFLDLLFDPAGKYGQYGQWRTERCFPAHSPRSPSPTGASSSTAAWRSSLRRSRTTQTPKGCANIWLRQMREKRT